MCIRDSIKEAAAKIREDSDVLVVAGIGGSYLGARAVIEMCIRDRWLACSPLTLA